MGAVAPWIGAYFVVLVLWAIALLVVRRPTLWNGSSFLLVNLACVYSTAALLLVGREWPGFGIKVFALLLLFTGQLASRKLILLHVSRAEAEAILEKCLTQTRANYERKGEDFVVPASANLTITMLGRWPGIRVQFLHGAGSRKAQLVEALFRKQFSGSFPTIRVPT